MQHKLLQLTQRDAPRHFQSWFETFEYVEVFYSSKDIDFFKYWYFENKLYFNVAIIIRREKREKKW